MPVPSMLNSPGSGTATLVVEVPKADVVPGKMPLPVSITNVNEPVALFPLPSAPVTLAIRVYR